MQYSERQAHIPLAPTQPNTTATTGFPESGELRVPHPEDWRACSYVTRSHGKTFYFASQLLTPHKRRAIHSAYAFCRVADDIVDRSPVLGEDLVEDRLTAWESQLDSPVDPTRGCLRPYPPGVRHLCNSQPGSHRRRPHGLRATYV